MKSSDFLFAVPNFITGVARLLDFGSTLNVYNTSDSEEEADEKATYSDWYMVGSDIKGAMEEYDRLEQEETSEKRQYSF